MNDMNLMFAEISGELPLRSPGGGTVEMLDAVLRQRNSPRFDRRQKAADSVETADVEIEPIGVDPLRQLNELPLGATDIEVRYELQQSNSIFPHTHAETSPFPDQATLNFLIQFCHR